MRELRLGVAQQGFVCVAYVLAAAVGVHNQPWRGPLSEQRPLQSSGHPGLGHVGAHLPADHLLRAHVLEGTATGPVAESKRQAGESLTHTRLA